MPNKVRRLALARPLLRNCARSAPVTYRIQRSTRPGSSVFVLSGVLDADHAARLGELLATEADVRIVIDLRSVTLVDRAGVCFLARAQAAGAEIVNCPEYVRSWIDAEQGGA